MKLKSVLLLLLLTVSFISTAQIAADDILFSVDDTPVYASEFVRVYNKNLDLVKDESQKDVDAYLQLFINYKLKLAEAKALKLDQKTSYQKELKSYRNQLAQNYLTDNTVTDELVEEAYTRLKTDVKARHILVKIDANASPSDTLAAYMKIVKLRKRLIDEGFEKVSKDVHDGKELFVEDLGYFSAFRMVYSFENAAYNTQVGDVSQPFRTRFGYHVVQVLDKRPARGTVKVAHIMVDKNKPGDTISNPEARINDIYKKLNQGESFESLAKQFSEDKSSSDRGGELAPFSMGQLSSNEFEEAAFNLVVVGEVSEPFKTDFGWHIVKLLDKKPVPPFEEIKAELEDKVKQDTRSERINETRIQDLKDKYKVTEKQDALPYFVKILNKKYYTNTWELPSNFTGDKELLKLGTKSIMYRDFGTFLKDRQMLFSDKVPYSTIVDINYKAFLDQELKIYQEANLENEYPEFADIVGEYRDGLLLFDLMETEIWNAGISDTIAVKAYYNSHKEDYIWNSRIDAVVAASVEKKVVKKVAKLLKKNVPLEDIKAKYNVNDEIHVIFTSGILEKNHQSLPESFEFKTGISDIYEFNDGYIVAKVNTVLPQSPKSYEEAKGNVISDFQANKEDLWMQELHAKYTVTVNESVLTEVRNEINNQ
ncbi:peptidyl-prolyl cis-trans isomerase SurA [Formosa agariphila KMM 3901]|uniref:peptidylprolyl isomerase n=1 Tax=Formosa agariphila (strain DSM 15362 / KCTC 12365 / LMG 23005 / KMM 3901 / M-2Alg 35-1) TaxID=1347342 RepID=T2KKP9_FORAG|nr:peptidylprolyl isomerase [Formosa agariphila]CDF78589.1 peptidyl-prolyl cis-trans isomerase SurA [Formosa agariphila KMM 3901]